MAGSLVVSRRVKLAERPPGSLLVCAMCIQGTLRCVYAILMKNSKIAPNMTPCREFFTKH